MAIEQKLTAEQHTLEHQYIVDRYSQSLTKYDVKALFEKAIKRTGSLAAATKEAEITRKTVYDWDKTSDDIKATTKRKILQTSLEADYYWTLEFLNRKTDMEHKEILERYINSKVEKITSISGVEEFQKYTTDFVKFLKANTGAVLDLRSMHIEELLKAVNEKAQSIGTDGISGGVEFINPQILSHKFMLLLEAISLKTMTKEEMPSRFNLPQDFVEQACKMARYINPTNNAPEDFNNVLAPRNPIDIQKVSFEQPFEQLFEQPFPSLRARRHG